MREGKNWKRKLTLSKVNSNLRPVNVEPQQDEMEGDGGVNMAV